MLYSLNCRYTNCQKPFLIQSGNSARLIIHFQPLHQAYRSRITQGVCTDTSACISNYPVGVPALQTGDLVIFPNPVWNELIIENKVSNEKLFFEIYNSMGQAVYKDDLFEKTVVQTSDFPPGIYLVKITGRDFFEWRKIVKY